MIAPARNDIVILGTGAFAGRIALDIAATAREPVDTVIIGRNVERLDWLRTAGNARAAMFDTPARFTTVEADLLDATVVEDLVARLRPRVLVQAASIQPSSVIAGEANAWTSLVARGGLSVTAPFQALITARVAAAISARSPRTALINCCFPDVVDGLISALGHAVLCGTGNVAILSNMFAGALGIHEPNRIKVLAHYQTLAVWRGPADRRVGTRPPRVFVDEVEIADVFETFRDVRLTAEPAIEISGASGVTLIRALAAGRSWRGHVPGPGGLPGGYPVRLDGDALRLDLPDGIGAEEAIAWNASFEEANGLVMDGRRARHTGALREALAAVGYRHADGFDVGDLEIVCADLARLRDALQSSSV